MAVCEVESHGQGGARDVAYKWVKMTPRTVAALTMVRAWRGPCTLRFGHTPGLDGIPSELYRRLVSVADRRRLELLTDWLTD